MNTVLFLLQHTGSRKTTNEETAVWRVFFSYFLVLWRNWMNPERSAVWPNPRTRSYWKTPGPKCFDLPVWVAHGRNIESRGQALSLVDQFVKVFEKIVFWNGYFRLTPIAQHVHAWTESHNRHFLFWSFQMDSFNLPKKRKAKLNDTKGINRVARVLCHAVFLLRCFRRELQTWSQLTNVLCLVFVADEMRLTLRWPVSQFLTWWRTAIPTSGYRRCEQLSKRLQQKDLCLCAF